jgi:hypothetical protein
MNTFLRRFVLFTLAFSLALAAEAKTSAQSAYYYDANEGGWVDPQAGLVWATDPVQIAGFDAFFDPYLQPMDFADAEALVANYPAFCAYWGWTDYATVVAYWEDQGLLWRQPTLKEAQDAWSKGLVDLPPWSYSGPRWTSTSGTKGKLKNGEYTINSDHGVVGLEDPVTYRAYPLVVRNLH